MFMDKCYGGSGWEINFDKNLRKLCADDPICLNTNKGVNWYAGKGKEYSRLDTN